MREKVAKIKPATVKIVTKDSLGPLQGRQVRVEMGSGFVVNPDGYIVTNAHIVRMDDPRLTEIIFPGGKPIPCTNIVVRNAVRDYVVLKIEGRGFPYLRLGTFAQAEEGDPVLFCGYPLEENIYSALPATHMGYISAKLQGILLNNEPTDYFKLDASVNNGNSGGPLVSQETGEVIGIITAKVGGIDNRMKEFVQVFTTFQMPQITFHVGNRSYDPNRILAEFMDLMSKYSNVGIGIAFSIEYVKSELRKREII